jgi:hypothetical protein
MKTKSHPYLVPTSLASGSKARLATKSTSTRRLWDPAFCQQLLHRLADPHLVPEVVQYPRTTRGPVVHKVELLAGSGSQCILRFQHRGHRVGGAFHGIGVGLVLATKAADNLGPNTRRPTGPHWLSASWR